MARSAHIGAAEYSFTPHGWHYSSFFNGSNSSFVCNGPYGWMH